MFATESIKKNLDENENVAAVFLDLSKASDSISHKILLQKLRNINFDEKALMETYRTKRHQKVTLSTCDSEWIQLYQDVPQGTVLGPLLFNIYVNERQRTVTENCSLIQYADDTMIFPSHSDAKQAFEKLNTNVKNLIEFF